MTAPKPEPVSDPKLAEGLAESVKRLEAEHARLVFKAKNLQARGKIVMARQEQVIADSLRIVLDALKRKDVEIGVEAERGDHAVLRLNETEAALREAQGKLEVHDLDTQNHGSVMMASQIRKAIESGVGRFSEDNANWILDTLRQASERENQLRAALEAGSMEVERLSEWLAELGHPRQEKTCEVLEAARAALSPIPAEEK